MSATRAEAAETLDGGSNPRPTRFLPPRAARRFLPSAYFCPSLLTSPKNEDSKLQTHLLCPPLPPSCLCAVLFEMSNLLNCGMDKQSLSICVELIGPYICPRLPAFSS